MRSRRGLSPLTLVVSILVPAALAAGVAFAVTAEASTGSPAVHASRTPRAVATPAAAEFLAARTVAPAAEAPAAALALRLIVTPTTGGDLAVYSAPAAMAAHQVLPAFNELGSPLVLLATAQRGDWLQVLLPLRPNGSTGWVRVADVNTTAPQNRVEISRFTHQLRVIRISDGAVLLTSPAGLGKASTPTPTGEFFVRDHFPTGSNDHPYGPFAFGLSGHSDVYTQFGTGDGRIAIHGTNQPATIGVDASNGCVHVPNDVVLALIDLLPLGTPVVIS
jgi:lipoprotein-anchoring transpeptidase ErfK/SrfK